MDIKSQCLECGEPTNGGYSNGQGRFWCAPCYNKLNPPRVAKGIMNVINASQDPVVAREVLYDYFSEHVSNDVCNIIVDDYNNRIMNLWRKRCE